MLLGQSSIMLSVYSTKTDELLILQFVVLQSKTLSSVFSKQLWRNGVLFFGRADYLRSLVFGKLWLWKLKTF